MTAWRSWLPAAGALAARRPGGAGPRRTRGSEGEVMQPRRRQRTLQHLVTAILALALAVGAQLGPAAGRPAAATAGTAPDGPGTLSHFDRSRKDCLGTARNR